MNLCEQIYWHWRPIVRHSPLSPHQIFIRSVTYSPQLINYYPRDKTAMSEQSFHYSSPLFHIQYFPSLPLHSFMKMKLELAYSSLEPAPLLASYVSAHQFLSVSILLSASDLVSWRERPAWHRLSALPLSVSIWSSPPPPDSLFALSTASSTFDSALLPSSDLLRPLSCRGLLQVFHMGLTWMSSLFMAANAAEVLQEKPFFTPFFLLNCLWFQFLPFLSHHKRVSFGGFQRDFWQKKKTETSSPNSFHYLLL